jgi:hypothetical protein
MSGTAARHAAFWQAAMRYAVGDVEQEVYVHRSRTGLWRLGNLCCAVLMFLAASTGLQAKTLYVSGAGSDAADGRSAAQAFRTLQHAADLTSPGDTVLVMNGVYTNLRGGLAGGHGDGVVLSITHSGSPGHWIDYEAYTGQTPQIQFNGWEGVQFGPEVSYIQLKGFTITGNNAHVSLEGAWKQGKVGDPQYSGNCVAADGRKGTATRRPNHLRILNNVIGDCGGGGVATIQADYVTVSGNIVFNSALYAIYGCSGISMLENWNSDNTTGYKMVVAGNRVYGNRELVPWVAAGKITDGEGIIIDTSRSPTLGNYTGRVLVANNLVYNNGSAAIEVFKSDHVDILNNSTYHDAQNPPERANGELNLNDVSDVRVFNNIFVSAPGQAPVVVIKSRPCGCLFGWDETFGGANNPEQLKGDHLLQADPLYLAPDPPARSDLHDVDLRDVDLRVRPASLALDSGYAALAPKTDFAGTPRPQGAGVDRGAFEQAGRQ